MAKSIVRNMDKGKEIITPTFKAGLWYLTRYFGWIVDLVMKNILGPKEYQHIVRESKLEENYIKRGNRKFKR